MKQQVASRQSGAALAAFKAWAADNPLRQHGPKCSVCALPADVLAVVEGAWAEGFRSTQIVGYLRTQGLPFPRMRIEHHFRSEHHLRGRK